MALLHCDGFDGQTTKLVNAYTAGFQTNGSYVTGRFGTGYAYQGQLGSGTYSQFQKAFPSARTTIFTGMAFKLPVNTQGGIEGAVFDFVSGGTSVLNLRVNGNDVAPIGRLRAVRGAMSTAGTQLGITSLAVPNATWHFIEMKIVCGTGTSGSLIVKQNGVETLNLTGIDTGSASLTEMALRFGAATTTGGHDAVADDWWVCDDTGSTNNTFLGDCRVLTMVPIGAGSSTQLTPSTGSNWSCVDEIPPVTTDYVAGTAPGYKDLYDYTALGASYQDIKGARLVSYTVQNDAGVIKGRNICKSGVTIGTGADNTMNATAQAFSTLFETDPNTSALWTNTNLNAAEFGWEVRS